MMIYHKNWQQYSDSNQHGKTGLQQDISMGSREMYIESLRGIWMNQPPTHKLQIGIKTHNWLATILLLLTMESKSGKYALFKFGDWSVKQDVES